jgi:hypothetical protein
MLTCRRCHKGLRAVRWHRVLAEMFAYFGEFARWDGLTERYTLYEVGAPWFVMAAQVAAHVAADHDAGPPVAPNNCSNCRLQDDACTAVSEVREVYRRRKDCLLERRAAPKQATTLELFALGAAGALRMLRSAPGLREAEFDADARVDGLICRCQQVPDRLTPATWVYTVGCIH